MPDQDNYLQGKSSQPVIFRSAWVIRGHSGPVFRQEVLENGAVVVSNGLIRAIGRYSQIKKEYGQYPVRDLQYSILTPALVNGHCHLELSHLDLSSDSTTSKKYRGTMTEWIRDLLTAREKFSREHVDADTLILDHARRALKKMYDEGVALVGDVGNSLASINIGSGRYPQVYFLLELLGLSEASEAKALARLERVTADESQDIGCTPHAPYSTTPRLLQAIKTEAVRADRIISIHVAESEGEVEFLYHGTGEFRNFLNERGAWDAGFTVPGKLPMHFLNGLGFLDSRTVCVHCVHLSKAEIEILSEKKAGVCLCPGSNRFLGVGRAPVTEFLDHGILPALGTDSRSSNEKLSMWREMRLLREDHPGLEPESVFAMATYGGADAWGVSAEIGCLAPGRKARILAVDNSEKADSPAKIFEFLTSADESLQLKLLE